MSRAEFLAAPIDACVIGRGYLVWCASPTLAGTVLWGAPDEAALREAAELWAGETLSGYDCIVDAARLQSIEPECLNVVSAHLREHAGRYATTIRRQAVILPRDLVAGSLVAGVPAFVELRHQWRAFLDDAEALVWLDRPDVADACAEVRRLVDEAQSRDSTLAAARAYLESHPTAVSLAELSRAIGRSTRSVQRHLQQHDSSFRLELRRARVRTAAQLLAATDLKLESVARRVGYRSLSHFSDAFQAELGRRPRAYRESQKQPQPFNDGAPTAK